MKKIRSVFLILIITILVLPIIFLNTRTNQVSEIDNRMLYELEDYSIDSIESYLNDRSGFRDKMIRFYNQFNQNVLNTMTYPGYLLGNDNTNLYASTITTSGFNNYMDKFLDATKKLQDYCEDRGIKFYFVLDPSKINVESEYVPNSINYNSQWLEYFIINAKEKDINIVEKYNYFNEIKDEVTLFNKEYDVYHWNDMGAFYGTNFLLKELHKDFEQIEENSLDDYNVSTETKYYIENSEYPIDEEITILTPKEKVEDLSDYYKDGLELYGDFQEFFSYKSNNKNGITLLSFLSSYYVSTDRAERFLANSFENTNVVHTYQNIYRLPYYINIYRPDIVIFEVGDYTFGEYYFSEYFMETMYLPTAFSDLQYENEINEETKLNVAREDNGAYSTFIINNPEIGFDYAYVCIDDVIYDCYIFDNENMAITFKTEDCTKQDDIVVKYYDESESCLYSYSIMINENN